MKYLLYYRKLRQFDVFFWLRLQHQKNTYLLLLYEMAVPQVRRLVAGFPPLRPGFESRSGNVGFVVDKVALGQVSSEYSGFSCQFSFHRLLHIQNHLSSGYNRPISGRRSKWTHPYLHPKKLKTKLLYEIVQAVGHVLKVITICIHFCNAI
jgi:hypothetical protein